jgi:hypothetical protein
MWVQINMSSLERQLSVAKGASLKEGEVTPLFFFA